MKEVWEVELKYTEASGEHETVHVLATSAANAEGKALAIGKRTHPPSFECGKPYAVKVELICVLD